MSPSCQSGEDVCAICISACGFSKLIQDNIAVRVIIFSKLHIGTIHYDHKLTMGYQGKIGQCCCFSTRNGLLLQNGEQLQFVQQRLTLQFLSTSVKRRLTIFHIVTAGTQQPMQHKHRTAAYSSLALFERCS